MAVTWWMPSSFMVRLDLRWTKSSCTSNYIVRGSPAAGARRPPASCGRAVDALDRLLAAGDRVAEAVGRQPRRRAALDRRHADQFTLEALLGGGHARVAVVVEVGLVGPRVQAAQERDEVRIGRRVGVVARQEARLALADAARGDRSADELERDRVADAEVRPDVAGDERVDVAGDEHDVLDAVGLDEAEQLLALGGIALPAVELRERAGGELDRQIITSLGITFHAACGPRSRVWTHCICACPRSARGWLSSGHGGAIASLHGWSARYWRW